MAGDFRCEECKCSLPYHYAACSRATGKANKLGLVEERADGRCQECGKQLPAHLESCSSSEGSLTVTHEGKMTPTQRRIAVERMFEENKSYDDVRLAFPDLKSGHIYEMKAVWKRKKRADVVNMKTTLKQTTKKETGELSAQKSEHKKNGERTSQRLTDFIESLENEREILQCRIAAIDTVLEAYDDELVLPGSLERG